MRSLSLFVGLSITPVVFSLIYKGYEEKYSHYTNATIADDYLTFRLVEGLDDCLGFCNNVTGCGFTNIYHDVNGKDGSPLFTCSLFKFCHDNSTSTNYGGQRQPDGSINYITDSDGWCKLIL